MNWKSKAVTQRALSALPMGYRLNYVLQRYVTHSLPRRGAVLHEVVTTARRHLDAVTRHTGSSVSALRFFQFGAGYDLSEPLAAAAMGVQNQLLFDIRPLARPSIIRRTAEELRALGLDLPVPPSSGSLDRWLASVGIRYVAPGDVRATGLAAGSIDVVTTTSVLEHIPPPDLEAILREIRRILTPGGLCSFAIDYHDHFARGDSTIDGLNFLRYDARQWSRWNSDLQFQNRLRHGDYVAMFEAAGFEIPEVEATVDPSFPAEPILAPAFRNRRDLAFGDGWFVLSSPQTV